MKSIFKTLDKVAYLPIVLLLLSLSCKNNTIIPEDNELQLTPIWTFSDIPDLEYAAISRNGRWAIVASDQKIAFLDLQNKAKLFEYTPTEQDYYVERVSISDQGYALVSGSYSNGVIIKVFSYADGLIGNVSEITYNNAVYHVGGYAVKIAPSGNCYYANGFAKLIVPNLLVWLNPINIQDNQGNWHYNPNYESSNDLDVSGNGEYVASASGIYNSPVLISGDGQMLWKSAVSNDAETSIKISHSGNKIVLGTLSEVAVYSISSPNPLFVWRPSSSYYPGFQVAVSDDGNVIAAGDAGRLVIFEGTSTTPTIISNKPDGIVNDIAISGDGNIIVLATDFGGLEIYNKQGELIKQHDSQYSGVVKSVSISADGKFIGCIFNGKFNLYKLTN